MKITKLLRITLVSLLLVMAMPNVFAQQRRAQTGAVIKGIVVDKAKQVLPGAFIRLVSYDIWTVADANGKFILNNVPLGQVEFTVELIGYETRAMNPVIAEKKEYDLTIVMEESSLAIQQVTVVAKQSKSGAATGSKINSTALSHMQAASLADVSQLLPGYKATADNLTASQTLSIRSANDNSFGTAVVVDGAAISNNANMQGLTTDKAQGVDLRQISADNIESVEVIRGVPSAEYGDLASGAVIVTTKTGRTNLEMNAKINQTQKMVYAGKGFSLGENNSVLNINGDYTYATEDPRFISKSYQRINGQIGYSNTIKKLTLNTKLSFGATKDLSEPDPDRIKSVNYSKNQQHNFLFSGNAMLNLDKLFARTLRLEVAANYTEQENWNKNASNSGSITEIFSSKTTNRFVELPTTPANYTYEYTTFGKPILFSAKLTNRFFIKTSLGTNRFLVGAEYRTEGNNGKGQVFDPLFPPARDTRNRPFSDIPFLNQLSAFAEDNFEAKLFGRDLKIIAGVRFEMIQPGDVQEKIAVSPRINASYKLTKFLSVKGAYGITNKTPSLLMLYPSDVYYDAINVKYPGDKQNDIPALFVGSTTVYSRQNNDINPSKTTKFETGFDLKVLSSNISVALYSERTKNGFNVVKVFEPVYNPVWSIANGGLVANPGSKPTYDKNNPGQVDTAWFYRDMYTNSACIDSKGIEVDADLGTIRAIRTSIFVNGAYLYTKSTGSGSEFDLPAANTAKESYLGVPKMYGIFDGKTNGHKYERLSGAVRLVHHIPEIRLLVSLAAHCTWIESNQVIVREYPIGYIDTKGNIFSLTVEEARSGKYDKISYSVKDDAYEASKFTSPLWTFSMKLTKEIGKNVGVSFNANNFFQYDPYRTSTKTPPQRAMGVSKLFFGAELFFKL